MAITAEAITAEVYVATPEGVILDRRRNSHPSFDPDALTNGEGAVPEDAPVTIEDRRKGRAHAVAVYLRGIGRDRRNPQQQTDFRTLGIETDRRSVDYGTDTTVVLLPNVEVEPVHVEPNYYLENESLIQLEDSMVAKAREAHPEGGVVAVVTTNQSEYSNFARTTEMRVFAPYDYELGMKDHEDRSLFVFMVDLDIDRIAHVKRIVAAKPTLEPGTEFPTGVETVDHRLTAPVPRERAKLEEMLRYHDIADFARCWNITSNTEIPDGIGRGAVVPSRDKPYPVMSYKAIFELAPEYGFTHVVAYVNQRARKSLDRLGMKVEFLNGQTFHLPAPENPFAYDEEYVAVCIPYEGNTQCFTAFNPDKPMTKLVADKNVPIVHL